MRLTRGIVNRLDAARLTEVVYYSPAGFSSFSPRTESCSGSAADWGRAQDSSGFRASGSQNLALANTQSIGHRLAAYGDVSPILAGYSTRKRIPSGDLKEDLDDDCHLYRFAVSHRRLKPPLAYRIQRAIV